MLADDRGPDRRSDRHAELLGRLVAADPTIGTELVVRAAESDDPVLLVAAALATGDRGHLDRASHQARTARERQLVALADTYLQGDRALFDVLVREHLAAYPDQLLAAWIAGEHT